MNLKEARKIVSGLAEQGDAQAAASQYSADIRQEMLIIKGAYRAINEFAFSLASINRSAKGGGPIVQKVRRRRLATIKERTKTWLKMIDEAFKGI